MIEIYKERVEKLRVYVRQRGQAHGVLIPRTDIYQGEYVAECDERLAWLTGFTGSNGFAFILQEKAALFVDGRYVLQARQQVPSFIDVYHSGQMPAETWLSLHANAGDKILYDPWLHTSQQLKGWQKICKSLSLMMEETPENPIDVLWQQDRPARPLNPILLHDNAFSGIDRSEKIENIEKQLLKTRADVLVLSSPESICWLLNIRGSDFPYLPVVDAFALVYTYQKIDLFIDSRKITPEVHQTLSPYVSFCSPSSFAEKLEALEGKVVIVDPRQTPQWILNQLEHATLVEREDLCVLPRALKNTVEQEGARAAHLRDGAAMTRFLAWLYESLRNEESLTELDLVQKIHDLRAENEFYQEDSFPAIVGFGAHGAIIHYRATEESNVTIEEDTLLLVDSGGHYLDGTTDVTRTIAVGLPSEEHRDRFTKVLKGHIALASVRFPKGTTGQQLDVLARFHLWQMGMDYDHGTGHGVGSFLNVHEGPQRISKLGGGVALQNGMILSNEPGYYKADHYGIRIENLMMVVRDSQDGDEQEMYTFETLTLVPLDRTLIDIDQLTADERDWINTYHERVREHLMPHVDTDTAVWLVEATEEV